jgi:DNA-binding response OmpR family regulator
LLIDDNVDANETLRHFLTLEGHTVSAAWNGGTGLAMAQKNLYDIIICDIGLPGINGYEVVRRLQMNLSKPKPCFIAITGYNQMESRIRAIDAGFDHYLVKPIAVDILLNLIALATPP